MELALGQALALALAQATALEQQVSQHDCSMTT